MTAQNYTPTGVFPYIRASGGSGPLQLQNRGDVLSEAGTFQANADIASVSNTTPIVVTTAAPHYFATGDKVIGVDSDDAAVNSPHTITVLTGTTFSLDGSTADGGGSATGIVTALQRGTLGKLIDACDIMGQALGMAANHVYGDPIAIPVGVTFNNTVAMSGGNVTVSAAIAMSGITTISGRRVRGARTVLTQVMSGPYTQTIKVTDGNRFQVVNNPSNVQIIKIADTGPTPQTNETIEILLPGPCSTGLQYQIRRADGTLIAEYYGNSAGDAGAWAEFEFVGGVWRLGANGGGGSAGGVLSGPGA